MTITIGMIFFADLQLIICNCHNITAYYVISY